MSIPSPCRLFMPWLVALAASLVLLASSPAQAQDAKPLAVVAFNSIDNLFEDADFLGGLAGQPDLSLQYQPMLKGFTPGLDHTKPIGVILQAEGSSFTGAIYVPVSDLRALLAFLKNFGITSEDAGDGTYTISGQGQTFHARESNGWAMISPTVQMLESLPDNPAELLGALTKDYDIGVRAHVQNIPEAYKQIGFDNLQIGMERGLNKLDSETDEEFAERKALTRIQVDQIKEQIQDLDTLTMGIAIDSEQQRTIFDFVYKAVAGSKLAKQIELNSNPRTDFAGFYQPDAAMMMSFVSKIAEADLAQADQGFEAMQKQIESKIREETGSQSPEERELINSIIADFAEAFKATVHKGKMDGGAVLNVSSNSLSFVAGGFIGDPAKVESGLKKLEAYTKKENPGFLGVAWNSASHADVQFHTFSLPIPNDVDIETTRRLFGDKVEMAVGIGKDSAYFAAGRDCLGAIKEIMDTSARSPQKAVPPMEMTIALNQIMDAVVALIDNDHREKPKFEMIAQMLASDANGRDHIRMVAQPIPNGLRIRAEAEEGVLRALGMAAKAAQMEAMEAAGAGGF